MHIFLKSTLSILLALVVYILLSKHCKDFSVLLTITVCSIVAVSAFSYLSPVMDFVRRLQSIGNLDEDMLEIILKSVGIGLLAEITNLICNDAGNTALGKSLQFIATATIIWLSIPLFNSLITLVDEILGAV